MKEKTIGRDEQAARVVAAIIAADIVLQSFGPEGDFTVGPYKKAVGPPAFAVFGYGRRVSSDRQEREGSAIEVARAFVASVGASRARDAALRSPGRPRLSSAAYECARQRAEHIRNCRK